MTTGCEFCQHPACWKSDIGYPYNVALNAEHKLHDRKQDPASIKKCSQDSGKLPTYNFLSFDFGGSTNGLENVLSEEDISDQESYDESNGSASEELSEKSSAPKTLNSQILAETLKSNVSGCTVTPNVSTNASFANYIQKLRARQIELERQECSKKWSDRHNRLVLHDLQLDSRFSFADDFEKVFTWIPAKKKKKKKTKESENEGKGISSKVIDGDALPDCLQKPSETRKGTRSPTGRKSRLKPRKREIDHKELTLQDYIQLFKLPGITGYNTDNRGNVSIPSPSRTARMGIIPCNLKAQTAPNVARKYLASQSSMATTTDVVDNKTMYIERGNQRQKSLVFLHSREEEIRKTDENSKGCSIQPECKTDTEKQKKQRCKRSNILDSKVRKQRRTRGLLGITHVSIPRRALQRYPLFNHCRQSIRKDALDEDIHIQPLSGSEHSSLCTLSVADDNVAKKNDDVNENRKVLSGMLRNDSTVPVVPMPSPMSVKSWYSVLPDILHRSGSIIANTDSCNNKSAEFFGDDTSEFTPINSGTSLGGMRSHVLKGHSSVHFQIPRKYSSQENRRTSTAPSFFSSTLLKDLLEENSAPFHRTTSAISKPESEDSCLDKEMINRTYDKYQSLTPFKTPLQSRHGLEDVNAECIDKTLINDKSLYEDHCFIRPNKRPLFSQSMHNLNTSCLNYLVHDMLRPNRSRSLCTRQQKSGVQSTVPDEMKISQVQLFSPRDEPPFVQNKEPKREHQQPNSYNMAEFEFMTTIGKAIACNQVPLPSPALSKQTYSETSVKQLVFSIKVDPTTVSDNDYDDDEELPTSVISNIAVTSSEIANEMVNECPFDPLNTTDNFQKDERETSITSTEQETLENKDVEASLSNVDVDKELSLDEKAIEKEIKINECDVSNKNLFAEGELTNIGLDALKDDFGMKELYDTENTEVDAPLDEDDNLSTSSSNASSTLEPLETDDFTVGLSSNFELDEDIMRAIENIDYFIMDSDGEEEI